MSPRKDRSHSPPPGTDGSRVIKTVRFRRGRATKACEVCHARKVRCDMTENFPCTNCRAFSLTCVPRESKGKGRRSDAHHNDDSQTIGKQQLAQHPQETAIKSATPPDIETENRCVNGYPRYPEGISQQISAVESNHRFSDNPGRNRSRQYLNSWREGTHATGEEPEDEFIVDLLKLGMNTVSLPPCEADVISVRAHGSFLLPSPEVSDHLIEHYFKYVHPYIPVINRNKFMAEYREDRDKPSLILRQAMYCVASRLSDHPDILPDTQRPRSAALVFYRRAKALYDARIDYNIETWITAAIILSLAVDNPLYMEHNGYYWVRVAAAQAQGVGMHRKLRENEVSKEKRSHWRRLWWTLYKRDISTAMAYGKPVIINLEDSDVEMICAEDFLDSEGPNIGPGTEAEINTNYFIHSVRLHEILALIMRVQFTVGAERLRRLHLLPDVTQCDRALAEWVNQLSPVLRYSIKDEKRYHYIRALLYLEYYTVVCLSHRPEVSHLFKVDGWQQFPTWNIAFQAAHMICKIMENFAAHGDVRNLPGFSCYSCFSAIVMMSFQRRITRDKDDAINQEVERSLDTFKKVCKNLSRTHATGSWMMQLAQDLQKDKASHKLAKTMQMHPRFNTKPKPRSHVDTPIALATGPVESPENSGVNGTRGSGNNSNGNRAYSLDTPPPPPPNQPSPGRTRIPLADSPVCSNQNTSHLRTPPQLHTTTRAPYKQPSVDTNIGSMGDSGIDVLTPSTQLDGEQVDETGADPITGNSFTVSAGDLFPHDTGFIDFPQDQLNPPSALSSSDESDLNMIDWLGFLSSGPVKDELTPNVSLDI